MTLKSDDINYLIYRYLKESGFLHSSYIFQFESQIFKKDLPNVSTGSLIRVLQKGLQYMDVETHLNEDGTARLCTAPFSLIDKHVCSMEGNTHGGHTLVHDENSAMVAPAQDDEVMEDMDVPDTEHIKKRPKERMVERTQLLRGHTAPVFLCAWNPTSNHILATGAGDGTARIWTDNESSVALKHEAMADGAPVDVTCIAWNPQGTQLATACFSGQLRIWNSANGELKHALRSPSVPATAVPIIALRWNRKGSMLLAASLDGSMSQWDTATGQLLQEYKKAHNGSVLDIDWLDNSTFASCGADRSILLWGCESTEPTKTLTGHKADINTVRWHPSGKYLASASDDGSVKIWSSDTLLYDFIGHSQQVYTLQWLPRNDRFIVASASFDGTARVWDVTSQTCLRVLLGHTQAIHCLSFSSDGRYLATGSFDKTVRVWAIKDGSLYRTFVADDGIHDIQWATKGKIAVAVANNQAVLFEI